MQGTYVELVWIRSSALGDGTCRPGATIGQSHIADDRQHIFLSLRISHNDMSMS